MRMYQQHISQQALHWDVPGFKRGPGRQRTNWRGVVKKDLQNGTHQLSIDQNAVGVWPNTSIDYILVGWTKAKAQLVLPKVKIR